MQKSEKRQTYRPSDRFFTISGRQPVFHAKHHSSNRLGIEFAFKVQRLQCRHEARDKSLHRILGALCEQARKEAQVFGQWPVPDEHWDREMNSEATIRARWRPFGSVTYIDHERQAFHQLSKIQWVNCRFRGCELFKAGNPQLKQLYGLKKQATSAALLVSIHYMASKPPTW